MKIGDWRLKIAGESCTTVFAWACEDPGANPHTWRSVLEHGRLDIADQRLDIGEWTCGDWRLKIAGESCTTVYARAYEDSGGHPHTFELTSPTTRIQSTRS